MIGPRVKARWCQRRGAKSTMRRGVVKVNAGQKAPKALAASDRGGEKGRVALHPALMAGGGGFGKPLCGVRLRDGAARDRASFAGQLCLTVR
jgi:hypothetical protein